MCLATVVVFLGAAYKAERRAEEEKFNANPQG